MCTIEPGPTVNTDRSPSVAQDALRDKFGVLFTVAARSFLGRFTRVLLVSRFCLKGVGDMFVGCPFCAWCGKWSIAEALQTQIVFEPANRAPKSVKSSMPTLRLHPSFVLQRT